MALQITYEAPTGDSYPAAYLLVADWNLSFRRREAVVVVELYRNDLARQADRKPVEVFARVMGAAVVQAILNRTDGDPRPAIYAWLKTLPEFAGAIDV